MNKCALNGTKDKTNAIYGSARHYFSQQKYSTSSVYPSFKAEKSETAFPILDIVCVRYDNDVPILFISYTHIYPLMFRDYIRRRLERKLVDWSLSKKFANRTAEGILK